MDKLKEMLIAIFGQDKVDALTEAQLIQLAAYADNLVPKEEVQTAVDAAKQEAQTATSDLQKAIDAAKQEATTATTAFEGLKRDVSLKSAISKFNVVNPDDFLKVVDSQGWQLDDKGNVKGLDAVMKDVKNSKPYLFTPDATPPNPAGGGGFNPPAGAAKTGYVAGMTFQDALADE